MRTDDSPTSEEQILRILSEVSEPLYSSDIAARLNRELGERRAYSPVDSREMHAEHGRARRPILGWAMDVEEAGGQTARFF